MGLFNRFKKKVRSENKDNDINNKFESNSTFFYLNTLIHNGEKEVSLNSDIILDYPNLENQNGIKIDVDDLIIEGNGHTIDAQNIGRIFQITGKNITLRNLILKNGNSDNDGGAIKLYDAESMNIINCTFIENNCEGSGGAIISLKTKLCIKKSHFDNNHSKVEGGAIFSNYDELNVLNCEFLNNYSNEGGAIYNGSKNLIITDTIFDGNSANGRLPFYDKNGVRNVRAHGGGAISSRGNTTIDYSKFINNISTKGGATKLRGIRLNNNVTEHNISNCFFERNASNNGGIIDNSEGSLKIEECMINENNAKFGFVLKNNCGFMRIFNCEILKNKSQNEIIQNMDQLEIFGTNFKNNKSKYVITNNEASNLSIFSGEFSDNILCYSTLYNNGKFCSITKTKFENNESDNNDYINIYNENELVLDEIKVNDNGKTIFNKGNLIIKSYSDIEKTIYNEGSLKTNYIPNESKQDFTHLDKIIHENEKREIILNQDFLFEEYEVDFFEGGIELDIDNLLIDGNGHIIDGNHKSRIFIITSKNITLRNITFKNGATFFNHNNKINNNGGSLRNNYSSTLKIENCNFIENHSEGNGGTISNFSEISIHDSKFSDNKTEKNGGAIENGLGGEIRINQCEFIDNDTKDQGGAIFNRGRLIINNSEFRQNTSVVGCGGSIKNNVEGKIELKNNTFANNTSDMGGGAISNEGHIKIENNSFLNNNVPGFLDYPLAKSGGAILNYGIMEIHYSSFTNNVANSGGAILNNQYSKMKIYDSIFKRNSSIVRGGAIKNSKGVLTIINTNFVDNLSYWGGAISNWRNGKIKIIDSIFTKNSAEDAGGLLNIEGEIDLSNCKFNENKPNDKKFIKKGIFK